MALFRYKLLNADGRVERGVVDLPFADTSPAIRYLERQGGVVVTCRRLGAVTAFVSKLVSRGFSRVKRRDLSEFFNNMAMLLGAGVPVLSAMEEIMEDMKNPVLLMTLKFMRTDIEGGQTFSEALSRHPKIFSQLIQYMCHIGEETGSLDQMCQRCADHLDHVDKIVSDTKRALVYPAFIFFVVLGACFFWFYFVVPRIVKLFVDVGVTIPWPTRLLIAISNWFQLYAVWTLLAVILLVIFLMFLRRRSNRVRYAMDYFTLRVPVFSRIVETSLVARISENLGILIGAGVGVVRTLEIITDSLGNLVYKGRLILVQDAVRNGNTLSDSLRQTEAMHPFAVRMISVGEQTGRIDEQTEYVASLYRDKLTGLVDVLGKTLEPALLIFMGVLFGAIFAGLLLPIYDMIGQLG
jgi:type II secretory pathway component PulF